MNPETDHRAAELFGRIAAALLWAEVADTLTVAAMKRGSRR